MRFLALLLMSTLFTAGVSYGQVMAMPELDRDLLLGKWKYDITHSPDNQFIDEMAPQILEFNADNTWKMSKDYFVLMGNYQIDGFSIVLKDTKSNVPDATPKDPRPLHVESLSKKELKLLGGSGHEGRVMTYLRLIEEKAQGQ